MKKDYQNKMVTGDQETTKSKSQQRREAEMQKTADGTMIEKLKNGKQLYNFPSLGKTVEAESYEEALNIINKEQ